MHGARDGKGRGGTHFVGQEGPFVHYGASGVSSCFATA